jgi:hypothetical protein
MERHIAMARHLAKTYKSVGASLSRPNKACHPLSNPGAVIKVGTYFNGPE